LNKQAREGSFTTKEAKGIYEALSQMPILEVLDNNTAYAVFPEFKANELFIRSVAIRLTDESK
jgi:hypothetical protein